MLDIQVVHVGLAWVIMEFENTYLNASEETRQREEAPIVQKAFPWDVQSLEAVIEGAGESFRGGMSDLLVLDTKYIDDPTVVETVWTTTVSGIPKVSLNRYNQDNWRNLKKNKLSLFTRDKRPTASKGKEASMKNGPALFVRRRLGFQNRDRNLVEFFRRGR